MIARHVVVAVLLAGTPRKLSIHSTRRIVAVHLLKKTGNLRQVQKQLGHASPATTANMSAYLAPSLLALGDWIQFGLRPSRGPVRRAT